MVPLVIVRLLNVSKLVSFGRVLFAVSSTVPVPGIQLLMLEMENDWAVNKPPFVMSMLPSRLAPPLPN